MLPILFKGKDGGESQHAGTHDTGSAHGQGGGAAGIIRKEPRPVHSFLRRLFIHYSVKMMPEPFGGYCILSQKRRKWFERANLDLLLLHTI